jgi:hypothetical protein
MAIQNSELLLYLGTPSATASVNGGRMTATRAVSGVVNNAFPNIGYAERTSGGRVRRKVFYKIANDDDLSALTPRIWLDKPTIGGEYAFFIAGTQRNVESDLSGSERKYGAANLKTGVSSGGSTVVVTVEDAALTGIYQNGDTIRISDKTTATSLTGNEEFHVINGAPSVSGLDVTLTLTGTLANAYTAAAGTRVSSVYMPADVACSISNWAETLGGTYNEGTYPVLPDNIGTVEQTWTVTFSSATAFSVSGDTVGSVGSGSTVADFAPTNASFSKPYFTLRAAGWGGTQVSGNTLVFQTHPAAVPLWVDRYTPAGTSEISSSIISLVLYCESAV